MRISLDTESTGLDLVHGAMPFLVTTCDDSGGPDDIKFWEWDVNPLTRRPEIPEGDLADVAELLDAAEMIYLQNAKFDARALATVGIALPWHKVRDTLVMGHLLASNHRHDLTSMCIEYIGTIIQPHEDKVKEVTQACRAIVKQAYPAWCLAREGAPGMPSVREASDRDEDKPWKNDMWVPRALYRAAPHLIPNDVHEEWLDACPRYANADSENALYLGIEMERLIRERGLWAIYEHRLLLPQIACDMEDYGVTAIGGHTEATIQDYERYVAEAGSALRDIAGGYGHELELAEGAALNDNMRDFFYGAEHMSCPRCGYAKRVKHWNGERAESGGCPKCGRGSKRKVAVVQKLNVSTQSNLALPVISNKKSGNASLDKDAMQEYLTTLEGGPLEFVRMLADKRRHDTDLTYMHAYRRFWLPVPGAPGYYRIHPSMNPFATDHLRWASNSPNMQNVSDQEEDCDECDGAGCSACNGTGKSRLSVRMCFGPIPSREWWRMDFKNLEKRIPAYEAQEPKLIEIFEKPDEPPYWGSDHNLLASLLYPDDYWPVAEIEGEFKRRHPKKYKRAKNTNFAKQYGAGRRKVEATSGVPGAFELIDRGLPELAKLQAKYLAIAERLGYVDTLPDRTVDPARGYPILASRTEGGRVLSTTPFNYHVSGTACWVKNTALIRCAEQLAKWRRDEGFDGHIALEVHDEILFDFPRGRAMEENLPRVRVLNRLMSQGGEDLVPRIPTPVSLHYHTETWAAGIEV